MILNFKKDKFFTLSFEFGSFKLIVWQLLLIVSFWGCVQTKSGNNNSKQSIDLMQWEGVYVAPIESLGYFNQKFMLYLDGERIYYKEWVNSDLRSRQYIRVDYIACCSLLDHKVIIPLSSKARIDKGVPNLVTSLFVLYPMSVNGKKLFMTEKGYEYYRESGRCDVSETYLKSEDINFADKDKRFMPLNNIEKAESISISTIEDGH